MRQVLRDSPGGEAKNMPWDLRYLKSQFGSQLLFLLKTDKNWKQRPEMWPKATFEDSWSSTHFYLLDQKLLCNHNEASVPWKCNWNPGWSKPMANFGAVYRVYLTSPEAEPKGHRVGPFRKPIWSTMADMGCRSVFRRCVLRGFSHGADRFPGPMLSHLGWPIHGLRPTSYRFERVFGHSMWNRDHNMREVLLSNCSTLSFLCLKKPMALQLWELRHLQPWNRCWLSPSSWEQEFGPALHGLGTSDLGQVVLRIMFWHQRPCDINPIATATGILRGWHCRESNCQTWLRVIRDSGAGDSFRLWNFLGTAFRHVQTGCRDADSDGCWGWRCFAVGVSPLSSVQLWGGPAFQGWQGLWEISSRTSTSSAFLEINSMLQTQTTNQPVPKK